MAQKVFLRVLLESKLFRCETIIHVCDLPFELHVPLCFQLHPMYFPSSGLFHPRIDSVSGHSWEACPEAQHFEMMQRPRYSASVPEALASSTAGQHCLL